MAGICRACKAVGWNYLSGCGHINTDGPLRLLQATLR